MEDLPLYDWSVAGFKRFTGTWQFDDFWTRGNTFDACLRFVMAVQARWPNDPATRQMEAFLSSTMIPANVAYLSDRVDSPAYWADDFGWWGIACLSARDYLQQVGESDKSDTLLELAKRCWNEMLSRGYDSSDAAKPVPHGCSNSPGGSPGTKNTVTNANLFLLSLRLYAALRSNKILAEPYLQTAYDQFLWFSSWFESDYGYLRLVQDKVGLVQERPIAPPDYERKSDPTWEEGWVWTGDQGLMAGALAGILSIKDDLIAWAQANKVPNFDPAAFEKNTQAWLATIIGGVKGLLFGAGFQPSDYVLREAPFDSSFVDDPKDYVCGRGVLLRYLSELDVGGGFRTGIEATAQALWNSRDGENQFGAEWNGRNDADFNRQFKSAWGKGDDTGTWQLAGSAKTNGIVQAIGLDVLGAAIKTTG